MLQVAFYKSSFGDLFDKAISWWTKGPYSHCELVLPNGQCFSSSPRDGGVRIKDIDLTDGKWDIWTLKIDSDGDIARIVEWGRQHLGKGYDWFGVFGFVFAPFHQEKDKWFCSEVIAAALQSQGYLLGASPSRLSPTDLYNELNRRGMLQSPSKTPNATFR